MSDTAPQDIAPESSNDPAVLSDAHRAELNAPTSAVPLEIGEVRHEGGRFEIKGPGPEWEGMHAEPLEDLPQGLPIGHVSEEAKGPGPEWEQTEMGEYVNR